MKRLLLSAFVVTLLVPVLFAQEVGVPTPAAELAKFKPLIGSWEGTGTATMAPGMPVMNWTSKGTVDWILDGHFIRDDARIDFEGGAMPTMIMRSFYGWDRAKKCFVQYAMGNTGELHGAEHVAWIDANTLVVIGSVVREGTPTVERSVLKFSGTECSFEVHSMAGAGDLSTLVKGTLRRGGTGFTISDAELKQGMFPTGDAMKQLANICGKYEMKGEMIPAPGAPSMPISGKESIHPIFNGNIIQMHVVGDPMAGDPTEFRYEGLAYLVWNPTQECYDEFWLNNMGETSVAELRWVDKNSLVGTHAGVQFGQPDATRATLQLTDSGVIRNVSMERMNANHAAVRAFFGEYTKSGADKVKDKE